MHIIVVDPSRFVKNIIRDIIGERVSKISMFDNGLDAYNFILKNPDVSIVLTSIELAKKSGMDLMWDICLMSQSGRPIYTIAMSATHEDAKLAEALDSGADDFIGKPPRKVELHARLRTAMRAVTLQNRLIDMANHDGLTGLLNRRALFADLEYRMSGPKTSGMFLALFDIDHFKVVNDSYGHHVGDRAIIAVAQTAKDIFKDKVARVGGEEFAVTLPAQGIENAFGMCERLRIACADLAVPADGRTARMTVSIGLCKIMPDEDLDEAYKRCDMALYDAKRGGRNRTCVYHPASAAFVA